MVEDYRRTEYDPEFGDISAKKVTLLEEIKAEHPRQQDIHSLVSVNDSVWKRKFMEIYNGKCAYCGVSLDIVPQRCFEIDHYIYKEHPRFGGSKAKAGYIDNLVLACNLCNRSKKDLNVPDDSHAYLHPDYVGITETFFRDEDFYIKIRDSMKGNENVIELYQSLNLAAEVHRLDYLLMSMKGLRRNISESSLAQKYLADAIDILQRKRNEFG